MSGAPAQAGIRLDHSDPDAERTPTLATAPEGLSARRVERWLDLPPGAWQRRRLYALRLTGQAFVSLGFLPGDLVIIEPGAKQQPGAVVVTRGAGGCSLKRILPLVSTGHRMPTVLELPLRERSSSSPPHVTGTVIGLLRPTGTGALRPVPLGGKARLKRRTTEPGAVASARESATIPSQTVPSEMLLRTLVDWRTWLLGIRRLDHVTPVDVERWGRLETSLATLINCLDHAHSPALRTALATEAVAIVADVRTTMGR